ncbi:MAG: hypothetical protein ACC656_06455 [Candidatus Heimdallarchaeota archaeon]
MSQEKSRQEQIQKLLDTGLIIQKDVQKLLDEKIQNIKTFLNDNLSISNETTEIKDEKHQQSKEMWSKFSEYLNNVEYNFRITGKEFHWLRNHILHKKAYEETSLFIGYRVKEDFLDTVDVGSVPKNDEKIENLSISIDIVTLIHHLIKDIVVTNLTDDKTLMFASILTEIGNISKLYSRFNSESESLSKLIYNWTVGLEPELNESIKQKLQENQNAQEIEAEEVETEQISKE